jgi:multicomponent Na+:H+ antiporter subunit B
LPAAWSRFAARSISIPWAISAFGLFVGTLAGVLSVFAGVPFMTGLWVYPTLFGVEIALSSVLVFDIGVYLVVVGAIGSIALALEERDRD